MRDAFTIECPGCEKSHFQSPTDIGTTRRVTCGSCRTRFRVNLKTQEVTHVFDSE